MRIVVGIGLRDRHVATVIAIRGWVRVRDSFARLLCGGATSHRVKKGPSLLHPFLGPLASSTPTTTSTYTLGTLRCCTGTGKGGGRPTAGTESLRAIARAHTRRTHRFARRRRAPSFAATGRVVLATGLRTLGKLHEHPSAAGRGRTCLGLVARICNSAPISPFRLWSGVALT